MSAQEDTRKRSPELQVLLKKINAAVAEHGFTDDPDETAPGESLDLQDVTDRMRDLVETLALYVDQEFIAPGVLATWIAGTHHLEQHVLLTPENRGPRRLAYLWLLDALMQSPDALIEAMIAARSQLVSADKALQPFAEVEG